MWIRRLNRRPRKSVCSKRESEAKQSSFREEKLSSSTAQLSSFQRCQTSHLNEQELRTLEEKTTTTTIVTEQNAVNQRHCISVWLQSQRKGIEENEISSQLWQICQFGKGEQICSRAMDWTKGYINSWIWRWNCVFYSYKSVFAFWQFDSRPKKGSTRFSRFSWWASSLVLFGIVETDARSSSASFRNSPDAIGSEKEGDDGKDGKREPKPTTKYASKWREKSKTIWQWFATKAARATDPARWQKQCEWQRSGRSTTKSTRQTTGAVRGSPCQRNGSIWSGISTAKIEKCTKA